MKFIIKSINKKNCKKGIKIKKKSEGALKGGWIGLSNKNQNLKINK